MTYITSIIGSFFEIVFEISPHYVAMNGLELFKCRVGQP